MGSPRKGSFGNVRRNYAKSLSDCKRLKLGVFTFADKNSVT